MKPIKNINKFKYSYTLNSYFIENKDPQIIIIFIFQHLYELIKELKYLPNIEPNDFGSEYFYNYKYYYKTILENTNKPWLLTLFPNNITNRINVFSFKRFYIGLVFRLVFCEGYWYGEPQNWTVNHHFYLNDENKLIKRSCQYILLDNYTRFQVSEESMPYGYRYYTYVLYNSINKYPGQNYIDDHMLFDTYKYENSSPYFHDENMILLLIEIYQKRYKEDYKKEIGDKWRELCNEYDGLLSNEYDKSFTWLEKELEKKLTSN